MGRKSSLRSLLIRNYTILSIVPILLFGGIGITTTVSYIREGLDEQKMILVHALSYELDEYINTGLSVLRHLASATMPEDSSEEIQHHLNTTVKYFDFFSSIEIISLEGKIRYIAPYDKQLIGNDVSRQGLLNADPHGRRYFISEPFISPSNQSPTLALTVPGLTYYYVGFFNLLDLGKMADKLSIGKTGHVMITDKNGYVLTHPDKKLVQQRLNIQHLNVIREGKEMKAGTFPYRFQGTEKLGTVIRHQKTGWYLIIEQNRNEANKPVHNILLIFGAILGITIIISVYLGLENRRKLLRPLHSLMTSAEHISGGDYDVQLKPSNYTEIDSLIKTFSDMITAIKDREKALYESTEQYRNLIEHAGSIIMRWNTDLRYTFLNSYALELFRFKETDLIGRKLIGTTHSEKGPSGMDTRRMLEDIFKNPEKYKTNENEVKTREGKPLWIQWSNKPIYDAEGNIREILSIGTDRTDYKAAEERITHSLHEKDILLKEIHHRVKNNMQIISSLLSLQAARMYDPRDIDLLIESQNRVHSMSLIHEQLYESDNLAEINFQDYIQDLVNYISGSYTSKGDTLSFFIEGKEMFLGIDKAIPCALITNELLSNAVKYAFPEKPANRRVDIILKHDTTYTLTVRDNGGGFPDGFDASRPRGLGYQLITALIQQLQGELRIENDNGAVVTVEFS